MLGDEFVPCDVDEEVLLDEDFNAALGAVAEVGGAAQEADGHAGDGLDGDHDARVKGAAAEVVHEVAQLLETDGLVGVEFAPYGADGGDGIWLFLGRHGRVFDQHFFRGRRREVQA